MTLCATHQRVKAFIANGLKLFTRLRLSRSHQFIQQACPPYSSVRTAPNISQIASSPHRQSSDLLAAAIRHCCERTQDVLALQNGSPKFKSVSVYQKLNT
jgi:hypothetical protein